MMPSIELELALVAACVAIQAFFAGSEIAVVSADRLALEAHADNGDGAAARTLRLLSRPTRFVGVCLLGANLATVAGASLVSHLVHRWDDTLWKPHGISAELVAVAAFVPVTVILAEVVPKSLFHRHADLLAPLLATPLAVVMRAAAPILWLGEKLERAVLSMVGASAHDPHAVRREDIRMLLEAGAGDDMQDEEKEMIRRVFDFSETRVEDAMVPLIEVAALRADATVDQAIATMVEQGWSRMPVYRERIDDIVGVVSHHDLLFAPDGKAQVLTVTKDVAYVPETTRVEDVFRALTTKRQRLAVVVDEYGGAVGLLSIEDIVEEIVGEIDDEFDGKRPNVRKSGEREFIASGRAEAEALLAVTGFDMPEGDYETLAGFLLAHLGHVPAVGERYTWKGWSFTVVSANGRAILEVMMQPVEAARARG